ncbi:hypothetical protein ACQP00_50410 [Dactylosporangium sp. CS-047395]|jgi:hypothetical protein|uniref:hypothetical protein n=1 Tax=Dactylosporangium sp. CS-047395 TaxID=3239936 RepID=UPI003D8F6260
MSALAKLGVTVVIAAAVIYFVVSWRVFNSPLTDAIGETFGSLAVLLLVVAIIGTARAN